MSDIKTLICRILKECVHLKRKESIYILADNSHLLLALAFYEIAVKLNAKATLNILPDISQKEVSPLVSLYPIIKLNDILLLLTENSQSHVPTRRKLSKIGLRIASMPGVNEDCLMRSMIGSAKEMIKLSEKLADILTIACNCRLTTPAGTDLRFSLKNRQGYSDTGQLNNPGDFTNLPAGEASTAPASTSTNGRLVIDGSFPTMGILKNPVEISIKDGRAVRITGGDEAVVIRKMLGSYGKDARVIAEIGIGTNPRAKFTGLTIEDEKVFGTMHVAFGNNLSFGGNNAVGCHYDAVIPSPTLVLDGKTVLKHGIFNV